MTADLRPRSGDWWGELDDCVLTCLAQNGAMSPAELARHVGVPESAAVSLLCLLIAEGRVRICQVEPATPARHDDRVARRSPKALS